MQKMIKNESLIMNRNSFLEKFTGSIAYQVENEQKSKFLFEELSYLTQHHLERCEKYANFVRTFKAHETRCTLSDIPFFSVRAFKEFELLSIDKKQIFKTMISSGTSGQAVSKIYLDQETASLQSRVLTNLMRDVTGPTRLPMLIIDAPNSVKNRTNFSARGAGIIGFSLYGKDVTFALNDDYSLNMDIVKSFFNRYVNKQVFVFGFTFMVWKCFLEKPLEFKTRVEQTLGIKKVVNYYGLVEQTGSLYFECEHGYLHSSVYSDVITRCPRDLSEVSHGDEGVIQVLSCIPRSYPGHSLLTDDLGVIHGVDDCKCGRKGKYFSINGRLEAAEVRGCSDAAK